MTDFKPARFKGVQAVRGQLQQHWDALAPREQRGLRWAAAVLGLTLAWWGLVAPAWRIVQAAPRQQAALEATLLQMQALEARAKQLRERAPVSGATLQKALLASSAAMGASARWQFSEGLAVLSLDAVPAAVLAEWLASVAGLAPAPAEAQLRREGSGASVGWSGTLLFRLPSPNP